eukprot:m.17141 g.17141  ORF g.17141 m.17141 type:complete len:248 (-) comp10653_c0_seq2:158-901(-)
MDFNAGLERYLLMAKVQKGAACREIIDQAISAPDVFMFQELLDLPQIQGLVGTEHEPTHRLLQCFAYGTVRQYKEQAALLPELKPEQHRKLQLLSIVFLCSQSKIVPYAELMQEAGIATVEDLEDTLIDAFGLGLVQGQLDQAQQQIQVTFAASRDLQEGDLDAMLNTITGWTNLAESTLTTLRTQMAQADSVKQARQDHSVAIQKQVEENTVKHQLDAKAAASNPRARAVRDAQSWGPSGMAGPSQ